MTKQANKNEVQLVIDNGDVLGTGKHAILCEYLSSLLINLNLGLGLIMDYT